VNIINTRKLSPIYQHLISVAIIFITFLTCFLSSQFIGYKTVALILLMTVSLLAMLFDILPVLIASILSALIWNFFFIPPIFTFHINNAEDLLMFLLYFFIALVNAVLTFKIRKEEKKVRDKEEKEKTIKLYNTLLNSLSHELRTPISTIIGAVDTLKENKGEISEANQTVLLNQIDIASIRLNRQVENLLNMSRLETGMLKPKFDWYDINELINSIIQKLDESDAQKIIFEQNESLPLFKFDRGLIEAVLQNLVHNAINYTPNSSSIKIEVLNDSANCYIHVIDNGKGIPESEINFLFDKFYRLPDTKTGGSGLGLSIVKGFVEAHNGKVKVKNNTLGGATFTLLLPIESTYINKLKNE
jgi:two-component system, OmpR family, sensor histidine kinase KdpD